MPAPVVLFVFNRPEHTERTIHALRKNLLASESDLFIFSDGPRSETDVLKVEQVRRFLRSVSGFKSINVSESERNQGLAKSVITGVTTVLEKFDRIIVLEDDMVTSMYFLSFMNQGLDLYEHEDRVISVHGYMYPVASVLPATFFLKSSDCWGWATWRRGWVLFETDSWKLLRDIFFKSSLKSFDFDNSYPYLRQLINQCFGLIDSWAIRWYASAFLHDKLSLYPGESFVKNIGFDDSGTHTRSWSKVFLDADKLSDGVQIGKIDICENREARKILARHFLQSRVSLWRKIAFKVKTFFAV